MDREVTLFPHPDSPTMATTSPFSAEKETPLTAGITPFSEKKWVFKFLILINFSDIYEPPLLLAWALGSRTSRSQSPKKMIPNRSEERRVGTVRILLR